jgi:hypothetical protein
VTHLLQFFIKEDNRSEAYQNFKIYLSFSPNDTNVPAIENFVDSYEFNGK